LVVDFFSPSFEGLLLNKELNRVVACSDGAHIPLKLVDLAPVVQPPKENLKQTTSDQAKQNHNADLVVLRLLLVFAHHTRVLHENWVLRKGTRAVHSRAETLRGPQVLRCEVELSLGLTNGLLQVSSDHWVVWPATVVDIHVCASFWVNIFVLVIHPVVQNFSNKTVRAAHLKLVNAHRNLGTLRGRVS
jgi:hypothetical protein